MHTILKSLAHTNTTSNFVPNTLQERLLKSANTADIQSSKFFMVVDTDGT